MRFLLIPFFALALFACKEPLAKLYDLPPPSYDTIKYHKYTHWVVYNSDSMLLLQPTNYYNPKKLIYTHPLTDGDIHWRGYDKTDTLYEVAYAKDGELFSKSEEEQYNRFDSIVSYYPSGIPKRIKLEGYYSAQSYEMGDGGRIKLILEYDSLGRLCGRITKATMYGDTYSDDYFHPNGKIESRRNVDHMFGADFSIDHIEWDSSGNKIAYHLYKRKLPQGKTGYDDVFSVCTSTTYYTNGKIKSITKEKNFTYEFAMPLWRMDVLQHRWQCDQHKAISALR